MSTARWRAEVIPALHLLLFGLALWALDRLLHDYPLRDITAALRAIPVSLVGLAALISALGYLALIGYDWVAFRFLGLDLPLHRMLIPSFVSFAISNSAPASMVTAGGVRYRMYLALGLTATGAVTVAGFNVVTYALGLAGLAGVALLLDPTGAGAHTFALPGRALGVLLLVGVAVYLLVARVGRGPRALRAAVGASIVMLLFAVERLISGTVPRSRTPKGGQCQRRTPPLPEAARGDARLDEGTGGGARGLRFPSLTGSGGYRRPSSSSWRNTGPNRV